MQQRLDQRGPALKTRVTAPRERHQNIRAQDTRSAQAAEGFAQMQDSIEDAVALYGKLNRIKTVEDEKKTKRNKLHAKRYNAKFKAMMPELHRQYQEQNPNWGTEADVDSYYSNDVFQGALNAMLPEDVDPELRQMVADSAYETTAGNYGAEKDKVMLQGYKDEMTDTLMSLRESGELDHAMISEVFDEYSELTKAERLQVMMSTSAAFAKQGDTSIIEWSKTGRDGQVVGGAAFQQQMAVHNQEAQNYATQQEKLKRADEIAYFETDNLNRVLDWDEENLKYMADLRQREMISQEKYESWLQIPKKNRDSVTNKGRDNAIKADWYAGAVNEGRDYTQFPEGAASRKLKERALYEGAIRDVESGKTNLSTDERIAQVSADIGFVYSEHAQFIKEGFLNVDYANMEAFDVNRVSAAVDVYKTYHKYNKAHAQKLIKDDNAAAIMSHLVMMWDGEKETLQKAVQQAHKNSVDPATGKPKPFRMFDAEKAWSDSDFSDYDGPSGSGLKDLYAIQYSIGRHNGLSEDAAEKFAEERVEGLTVEIGEARVPEQALVTKSGSMMNEEFLLAFNDALLSRNGIDPDDYDDYTLTSLDSTGSAWNVINNETGEPLTTTISLERLHGAFTQYDQALRDNTLNTLNADFVKALKNRKRMENRRKQRARGPYGMIN